MRHTTKIIICFIAVITLLSVGLISSAHDSKAKETIKIAFVGPLTGDIGFLGEGMRNAMNIAKDELKDTKYNYEYVFEDTQNDPKVVVSAVKKVMSIDKVDAILTLGVNAGLVTSPIVEKDNSVVHISIAIEPWVANGDTNFVHWTSSTKLNGLLVDEMKKRGIKTAGIFRTVTAEGYKVYAEDLFKLLKKAGIKLVSDQTFQNGEKSFRTIINKAKPSNPDIYVLFADTPELELLGKQIKEAGITAPLTSVESFEVSQNMDLFEGNWFVSVAEPSHSFAAEYEKRHGSRPPLCAPNAYDMVKLIVTAAENTSSSSKPSALEISKELTKIKNFPGALGTLYVDKDGMVQSEGSLKMIKNGKLSLP